MPASQADRSRAARARKAVMGGKATSEQMTWLEAYDARAAPAVPPHARQRPVVHSATLPVTNGQTDISLPDGHVVIDFGAPQAAPSSMVVAHDTSTCAAGPDCPRCRAVRGAIQCSTTGERVWPKMTVDGARGMAAMILGGICLVARMVFGKNVTPSQEEIAKMGDALRETIYQRAGALGAHDDMYALGFCLLSFGARVYNAPRIERLPA